MGGEGDIPLRTMMESLGVGDHRSVGDDSCGLRPLKGMQYFRRLPSCDVHHTCEDARCCGAHTYDL